jgi:hypothetical protein
LMSSLMINRSTPAAVVTATAPVAALTGVLTVMSTRRPAAATARSTEGYAQKNASFIVVVTLLMTSKAVVGANPG